MRSAETKPDCCVDKETLPTDTKCLERDISRKLSYLFSRHRCAFGRNRRITELAEAKPLARTHRFSNQCPYFFKKPIEIIRLDDKPNTRTEQLAFPRARYLLEFKQRIRKVFTPDRILNLNRLIRKSLFSLYSRLGNVQPPMEMKPKVKWNKEDWEKHTYILKKLAKPKKVKMPPRRPSKRLPLSQMKRYKKLARPRKFFAIEKPVWTLTKEMRKHKTTERTKMLAKPVVRDTSMLHQELPIQIPLGALKHKASQRTTELAKPNPRQTQTGPSDAKENPFVVSPNALKTNASKRTIELAEPREYENRHIREDPYTISKAALKAKARPRTIKLAQPRTI